MADNITTWARIEPHAATTDIDVGLAAEIADPMWFLARQLQLGEFTGDNGGTPTAIQMHASYTSLTHYRAGLLQSSENATSGTVEYDVLSMPLECMVETEPIDTSRAWHIRVRSGLEAEVRLMNAELAGSVEQLRLVCPFIAPDNVPCTGSDRRYAAMFGGKVTDGLELAAKYESGELDALKTASGRPEKFDEVFADWKKWFKAQFGAFPAQNPPSPSWQPERLEYAFAVSAPGFGDGEIVMAASEYDGTGLDWYHLDHVPELRISSTAVANMEGSVARVLPRSVSFPGMPADRFWEMEDGLIDLGSIDAGPTDLARLLATEYAVIYSPDWFIVPLELPVGCLARVDWVVVRDTFGTLTLVGTSAAQAADGAGRMFQPATFENELADVPFLFIPPSALYGQRGPLLEDVLLERDEQANVAWAIEKTVLGPAGRPVVVDDGRTNVKVDAEADTFGTDLIYQLATEVPVGWTPLVAEPVEGEGGIATMLRRALLLDTRSVETRQSVGQLSQDIDQVFEEEIGREGVRIQLLDQLARWTDGSTHVWRGRQKRSGLGESYAGLYFDHTKK